MDDELIFSTFLRHVQRCSYPADEKEVMAVRTKLETHHSFGEIIGKTEKMRHLSTQIQTAAAGDITVLI